MKKNLLISTKFWTYSKMSEHGSTLVLNVKLISSIGRPEGIAEIVCTFASPYGYKMVSLRDSDNNTIVRTMCK